MCFFLSRYSFTEWADYFPLPIRYFPDFKVAQNLFVFSCIYNSTNYDKIPNATGWYASPKTRQSLQCVLQVAAETYCCTCLLTTSVHIDSDLNQKFKVWNSLYKTCCHWFSVEFLGNLACFSVFSLSRQPPFHWDFWWGFGKHWWFIRKTRCISPVSGLCWIFSYFLRTWLSVYLLQIVFTPARSFVWHQTVCYV